MSKSSGRSRRAAIIGLSAILLAPRRAPTGAACPGSVRVILTHTREAAIAPLSDGRRGAGARLAHLDVASRRRLVRRTILAAPALCDRASAAIETGTLPRKTSFFYEAQEKGRCGRSRNLHVSDEFPSQSRR